MRNQLHKNGFTIVELLIVIVVIAILAAISIVAYNGIQSRSRDAQRYSDAKAILKGIELYKAENGRYPPTQTTGAATCASHNNGYSYSDATDSTWLATLVSGKQMSKIPVSPNPSCTVYYRYLYVSPGTTYNCPSRANSYFVLEIVGVETSMHPGDASDTSDGNQWVPCAGATAGWGYLKDWAFAKDDI